MVQVTARSSWSTAAAIGVLTAAAVVMPASSDTAQLTQQYVLAFELASPQAAIAQVFVDRGVGFEANAAVDVPIAPSPTPLPYSVPLSPGLYRRLRLDPIPAAGDFELRSVEIHDRYGRIARTLSLAEVAASESLSVREQSSHRLVASAVVGQSDPNLQFVLTPSMLLWLSPRDVAWFALVAVLIVIVTSGASYLALHHWDRQLRSAPDDWPATSNPRRLLIVVAVLAALAATYPLLLGRSLVTPNNGPTPLVYGTPPYVAGGTDTQIESARLADVQATMWVVLPYAVAQRHALAHGEWPWWNRYSENGAPLLGQGQGAFFDPLQWLLFAFDLALGADLKFVAARIVFTIGVALAALLATGSLSAAMVVTLAAPFISHFVGRFNDPIHFSLIYAPWILVGYGMLLKSETLAGHARATAVLVIFTALLIVASSLKETFALLPALHLSGVLALLLEARRRRQAGFALFNLVMITVASVAALMLTAPHWLTFLETLSNAFTAYDLDAFVFAGPLQAAALVSGVFMPGLIYPGVTPLISVLLVIALLSPHALLTRPLVTGCTVVSVVFLLVAFGAIPERVLAIVPLFSRIHHVGMTFITAVLPLLLVVAAAGAHAVFANAGRSTALATLVAVAVSMVMAGAFLTTGNLTDPIAGVSLTACLASGVMTFTLMTFRNEPTRSAAIVAALTGAVLLLPGGLQLPTGVAALDAFLVQPRERAPLTDVPAPLAPLAAEQSEPTRMTGMNGVLQSGVPTYLRLESVTGGDSLFSPHVYRLGTQFDPNFFPLSFRVTDPRTPHLAPLLDLWGVRWLITPSDAPERLAVIERQTAWPRAFYVDKVETYHGRNEFVSRLRADSQLFAAIDGADAIAVAAIAGRTGTATRSVRAHDYQLTANTTSFTIDAPEPGIVVLNETFWPGVSATVGGRAADVFRINETMRAVVVPQGTWRMKFSYRPATWNLALGLAASGVAALVVLLWLGRATAAR